MQQMVIAQICFRYCFYSNILLFSLQCHSDNVNWSTQSKNGSSATLSATNFTRTPPAIANKSYPTPISPSFVSRTTVQNHLILPLRSRFVQLFILYTRFNTDTHRSLYFKHTVFSVRYELNASDIILFATFQTAQHYLSHHTETTSIAQCSHVFISQ
jgi:hypothetical protein